MSKENDHAVFLLLDMSGETPLYQQIRDQIVVAIAEGHLPDGAALPTTRQLAGDFGINFHTVNKAYDVLRQEGFVQLTRKQGSFVRLASTADPRQVADWRARLRTLLAEAIARGLDETDILESCRATLASFPYPGK
ncbi:MAG: GntR family transcriptional regulator [Anaerolineales bacterium]|jgi:GntR family transcriptional regulator